MSHGTKSLKKVTLLSDLKICRVWER